MGKDPESSDLASLSRVYGRWCWNIESMDTNFEVSHPWCCHSICWQRTHQMLWKQTRVGVWYKFVFPLILFLLHTWFKIVTNPYSFCCEITCHMLQSFSGQKSDDVYVLFQNFANTLYFIAIIRVFCDSNCWILLWMNLQQKLLLNHFLLLQIYVFVVMACDFCLNWL